MKENQDDNQIFIEQINLVLNKFHPEEFAYLGMDGPNPAAKFQHQRFKRVREDIERLKKSNEPFEYPDENSYPNLDLEKVKIDDILKEFISNKIQQPDFQTKHVLYSGRYSPGEAEHKYMDYFRKQKELSTWKKNQNHFIFSRDCDLVFLALQFIDENFYIVQFDFNGNEISTFNIIDISSVREFFMGKIANQYIPRTNDFIKRVIDDIIVHSFILGNDFIPEFPDIEPFCTSFNQIIISYSICNKYKKNNYEFLIENNVINVSMLQQVVSRFFRYIENSDHSHTSPRKKKAVNVTTDPEQKNKAQSILRIFNFCFLYYTQGITSWTYYYPYKESINLKDAVNLMTQEEKEFFDNLDDKEITDPFLKLLGTHSPYKPGSIPWNVYKIKVHSESPIAEKYWPLIDDPKNIPIFDLKDIKIHYKEALKTISQEEKDLNQLDIPFYDFIKKD